MAACKHKTVTWSGAIDSRGDQEIDNHAQHAEFVQYDQDDNTAGDVVLGVDTLGSARGSGGNWIVDQLRRLAELRDEDVASTEKFRRGRGPPAGWPPSGGLTTLR